jgi:hypothetical protein
VGECLIEKGFYTNEKAIDFATQNGTKQSLLNSPVHNQRLHKDYGKL